MLYECSFLTVTNASWMQFSHLWGYLSFWSYFSCLPYFFFSTGVTYLLFLVVLDSEVHVRGFPQMSGEPYHLLIFEWICALVLLVVVFPEGSYYILLGPLHVSIYQFDCFFNWSISLYSSNSQTLVSWLFHTVKNYWGSYRPVLLTRNIMQIKIQDTWHFKYLVATLRVKGWNWYLIQ